MELAKKLWKLRWSLLKKPSNLSGEEKQAIAELEKADAGFVHSFRQHHPTAGEYLRPFAQ